MDKQIRVLLVEDTPIAQMVQKNHILKQGCEVDVAIDGQEALEKAINNPYDLILMDIGLGEGPDGFEVTQQIKIQSELNKKTPIVAVTSHGGTEYLGKARDAGMINYFNKPLTYENARDIIEYIKNKNSGYL